MGHVCSSGARRAWVLRGMGRSLYLRVELRGGEQPTTGCGLVAGTHRSRMGSVPTASPKLKYPKVRNCHISVCCFYF